MLRSTTRCFPSKRRCQIKIIECFLKVNCQVAILPLKKRLERSWSMIFSGTYPLNTPLWWAIYRHQSTPEMDSNKSGKGIVGDLWRSNYMALSTHHHPCSLSMTCNVNNDNNDTIMRRGRGMIVMQRLLYEMEMERMKEKRYISPFPHIGSICISGQLLCGEGSFCKPFTL